MSEIYSFVPRLLGKLWVAFLVRRWGGAGSMFGAQTTSPMLGTSWTLGQYVLAGVGGEIGARIFGRFVDAKEFRKGAWDMILTKLIWTEGLARSPWLQQTFGADGDVMYDPGSGQMMIQQGGRWESMQGMGDLVQASPLDGLVEASPLDGDTSYSYGHLLPEGVSEETARRGMYTGSGFKSPYQAAYSYR